MRTDCPEIEVLEQYTRGLLPEAEKRDFQAHLEECGLCSLTVERLQEFDTVAGELASEAEPDWARMEARLESECRSAPRVRDLGRESRGWRQGWIWVAALGYALALVLLYPAWLGMARRPAPAPVEAPRLIASAAVVVDLNTTRGEQGLPVMTLRAGEHAAVLSFFVPGLAGARYVASIADEAGKVAAEAGEIRSHDGHGNYYVVVDPSALPAGRYRVAVREKDRPGASPSVFEFERR